MLSTLKKIKENLTRFLSSKTGKRIFSVVRNLVGVAVVALLGWQLYEIGWQSLISEMPRTPWFYVTVAVMYVTLPIFETGIYGSYFPIAKRNLFSVFIRKKVLNSDLMGYSGDVFVLFWIKEKLRISEGKVLRFMVDNGITSSLGAFSATGILFGILLTTGSIRLGDLVGENNPTLIVGSFLFAAVLGAVGYRFRRTIFSLPGKSVLSIYLAHFTRFMFNFSMQLLQWWIVLPDLPIEILGTMLAIYTISNRLPFVPSRDIVATALIMEMPGLTGEYEVAIAAMLLTRIVLDRFLNLSLFVPLSLSDRKKK